MANTQEGGGHRDSGGDKGKKSKAKGHKFSNIDAKAFISVVNSSQLDRIFLKGNTKLLFEYIESNTFIFLDPKVTVSKD